MMRRRFFLLAAPAIVAAPSLMRVSSAHMRMFLDTALYANDPKGLLRVKPRKLIVPPPLEVAAWTIIGVDAWGNRIEETIHTNETSKQPFKTVGWISFGA